MKVLAIDTSTPALSLAFGEDGEITAEYNLSLKARHSALLVPIIKELLERCGTDFGEIGAFALSIGPGSFTGLRVGVATVKGLTFGNAKAIVTVPTLDVIAFNSAGCKDLVCALTDAKQNKVYAAMYLWKGERLLRRSKDMLLPLDGVLKKIRRPALFIGDGVRIYRDRIKEHLGKKASFAPRNLWNPRAGAVLTLGWERLARGETVDCNSLVPVYLYPKECTIKKKNSCLQK